MDTKGAGGGAGQKDSGVVETQTDGFGESSLDDIPF